MTNARRQSLFIINSIHRLRFLDLYSDRSPVSDSHSLAPVRNEYAGYHLSLNAIN